MTKKWLIVVFCFVCLISCTKVDDNDKIKENDFSALELNTPDSREKRIEDSIVPVDTAIENIVNKLKKRHRAENNLFIADCMTIELPESFHAEFFTHWEMGDRYYVVKDFKDTEFMHFDIGLRSLSGLGKQIDVDSLTNDFIVDAKRDTISELHGKIIKIQNVVLQAKRRINKWYYPYVVDFVCRPDLVDSNICEKIISSAKTNHDCLEGIE